MDFDSRTVMEQVDRLVDKHLGGKIENKPTPVSILVVGNDPMESIRIATALRLSKEADHLNIVVDVPEPRLPKHRVLVVDREFLGKQLTESIRKLAVMEDLCPDPCYIEPSTEQEPAPKPQLQVRSKFKAFKEQKFNKGPTARRQHSMIRPPRRGGR